MQNYLEDLSWFDEYRPHQTEAIESAVSSYDTNDIVVLDAPTGSGKTLIAESIRHLLNVRGLYLCSSLSLQDQFAKDFPYAAVLRGRANYPTADYPERFNHRRDHLSAGDCDKRKEELPGCSRCTANSPGVRQLHCSWCHPVSRCPYESAKATALRSDLICSNTYYFLYEANYHGALSNRPFIVVDECDTLEKILMSFVQVHIPQKTARKYAIEGPTRKTIEEAWVEWVDASHKRIQDIIEREARRARNLDAKRQLAILRNIFDGLTRLKDPESGIQSGGWVYTGYARGDITFKPVEVSPFAEQYLWRHGRRWLLMSATVISTQVLLKSLGI